MERAGVRDAADRADPRALEGFVRALVGVREAAVESGRDGRVTTMWIVPAPGVPERQVRLNVLSALMAGPGLALDPDALRFTQALPDPAAPAAPAPPAAAVPGAPSPVSGRGAHPPAKTGPAPQPQPGTAVSAPSARAREPDAPMHGAVAVQATGTLPAALRMVRFDIEHPSPGRIRIIVGVLSGENTGLGVREGDERPGVAMDLAARAAADAARGTGTIGAAFQLAGVALTEVAGRTHVVAAVDVWTGSDFAARPGAAAVLASWEEAAARAVLAALCRY